MTVSDHSLVFATNNPNKLEEIQHILFNWFQILSLKDIGCTGELPENQVTLEGNASEKAFYIYNNYKINCFADDTGLEVEALNGKPGVFSARYAGISKSNEDNIFKLLSEMRNTLNRKARFRTVISLIINGKEKQFEGIINGNILNTPKGTGGFGYDPIFRPEGHHTTLAEIPIEEKNKISHRGIAIRKLANFLQNL